MYIHKFWRRLPYLSNGLKRFNSTHNIEVCSSNFTDHKSIRIIDNFITAEEESILFEEVEKKLRRMKYESNHWDAVIHGYREIQKLVWSETAHPIIQRLGSMVTPPLLPHTHVLDLSADGLITPHVDSVQHCGPSLAVLSLLSDAVMKLEHMQRDEQWFKVLIKRYSVYVLHGRLRYEYKHSILNGEAAVLNGRKVEKGRRLSIIIRSDVTEENKNME